MSSVRLVRRCRDSGCWVVSWRSDIAPVARPSQMPTWTRPALLSLQCCGSCSETRGLICSRTPFPAASILLEHSQALTEPGDGCLPHKDRRSLGSLSFVPVLPEHRYPPSSVLCSAPGRESWGWLSPGTGPPCSLSHALRAASLAQRAVLPALLHRTPGFFPCNSRG